MFASKCDFSVFDCCRVVGARMAGLRISNLMEFISGVVTESMRKTKNI